MNKEEMLAEVYRLCPEVKQLGLYPIVMARGHRY
jgi:hypothetical protein